MTNKETSEEISEEERLYFITLLAVFTGTNQSYYAKMSDEELIRNYHERLKQE